MACGKPGYFITGWRGLRFHAALSVLLLLLAVSVQAAGFPVISRYRDLREVPVYDARTFGCVGDGVTDNRASIQAAVSAASLNNQELYFPPGTYQLSLTTLNPKVSINGNLRLTGAGRGKTIIRVGPLPPADTAFLEGTTTQAIEITDLTLQGPTSAGATPPNPAPFRAYGLHLVSGSPGTGRCTLYHVDCAGTFTHPIYADAGVAGITHTLTVQDSDLTGYSGGVICLAEAGTTTRTLKVIGCAVHGLPNLGGSTGLDVGFSPNVAVDVDGCQFSNNPSLSVGPIGTASVAALYSRFADDVWASGVHALLLPANGPSEIRGSYFYNSGVGITLAHDAILTDDWFVGSAIGCQATASIASAPHTCLISNCRVENQMHLTCDGPDCRWQVSNCDLEPNGVGAGALGVVVGGTATVKLDQVRIANAGQVSGSSAVTVGAGCTLWMRGCSVNGDWDPALGAVSVASGVADVLVTNGEFVGAGTTPAVVAPNTGTDSGKITTRNLLYNGSRPQSPGTSWENGGLVVGIGTTLASAATLAFTLDGDTFHVTGANPITNLIPLNDPAVLRMLSGTTVTLIEDAGAPILTGGNIISKTTTPQPANTTRVFLYDGPTGLWTEQ